MHITRSAGYIINTHFIQSLQCKISITTNRGIFTVDIQYFRLFPLQCEFIPLGSKFVITKIETAITAFAARRIAFGAIFFNFPYIIDTLETSPASTSG